MKDKYTVCSDSALASQDRRGAGAISGGYNRVREDGSQRAEDGIRDPLLAVDLRADGAWLCGVYNAAFGGNDLHRPVDSFISRYIVAHQCLHREEYRRLGTGVRHIDRSFDLLCRTGEINRQFVAPDRHFHLNGEGIRVLIAAAVHIVRIAVFAVRKPGNHGAHTAFRVAYQLPHTGRQIILIPLIGFLNPLHAD